MFTGNIPLDAPLMSGLLRASAVSDRPSSSRNAEGFCHAAGKSSRSVLHHKVGLPLACYLHGGSSAVDTVAGLYFPNYSEQGVIGEDDHDKIFEESFNDWWKGAGAGAGAGEDTKDGEKAFVKMLAERVHQSLSLSRRAWGVKDDVFARKGRTRGYVGVLVQCDRDNKRRASPVPGDEPAQGDGAGDAPVLLVEVGLENEEWWTKLNHGYQYLRCVENLQGPLLLAAITFEPRGDGADPLHHRIGVFLATSSPSGSPGDDPDDGPFERRKFGTSLLWRSQATCIEKLSQSFGRVLRAARLLVEWDAAESLHRYLGPNCCLLIGPEPRVLRAYDNRLVYTNRRQDVYLEFFSDSTRTVVEYEDRAQVTVNHDEQAPEMLPFGTFQKGSNDRDWMWLFRGRFSVLSVPYHPGRHWAREISEFIPVLEQLRSLHREGFVHGDVRCSNIVFAKDNGNLIDFDFGGKVGGQNPPRFPANYVFKHEDGTRWARPKAAISRMDDAYAMTQVVFRFHQLDPPPPGEINPNDDLMEGTSLPPKKLKLEEELAELREKEKLGQELAAERGRLEKFALQEKDDPKAAEKQLTDLVAFLMKVQSQNWTAYPIPDMLQTMKRWGFTVDVSN